MNPVKALEESACGKVAIHVDRIMTTVVEADPFP